MDIIKFLNKSGKMALSALQAVGITAVVGAAGVGAWQYLSGPSDDNNVFNPAQYNPGEVVYVAGANTGGYSSVPSGANSSVQVSANTLKRMDRRAQAERMAQEMEEAQYYAADSGMQAYQLGGTEGLEMGANYVGDANSDSSPNGVASPSVAGMQNMINQVQQQVAGATAGPSNAAENSGAPALGSATPNWSRGGSGGSGGSGSSFALQDSGKNEGGRGGRSAASGTTAGQNPLDVASAQAASMLEGSNIKGRSPFRSSGSLNPGRNAVVQGGSRSKDAKDDMEFFTKRSADVAANKHRSNTEANVFLASTQLSGGMRIEGENVTTGQGQHSKDFQTDYETNLRGIHTWGQGVTEPGSEEEDIDLAEMRTQDQKSLLWLMAGFIVATFALMLVIATTKNIPLYGWIIAAAAAATIALMAAVLAFRVNEYQKMWGWDLLAGSGVVVAALLVAGIVGALVGAMSSWLKGIGEGLIKVLGISPEFFGLSAIFTGGSTVYGQAKKVDQINARNEELKAAQAEAKAAQNGDPDPGTGEE